ncbi:membrane protein [Streptomyces sodiiphilus]|uniref:Membrane protein n=1 Tax=Streptomyces sodiiphilus TaxID=226217 RepID=A0ABN2PQ72_9ACTN
MNSADHLLPEDRTEFERILDKALRTARHTAERESGALPDTGRLRSMAMEAIDDIAPRAADEYRRFVELRSRLREPAAPVSGRSASPRGTTAAEGTDGNEERTGAGLAAVLSVLAPILAGTAAVVFLAFGYGLRLAGPEPAVAAPMRTAGWVFAALAAVGLLIGTVELLVTALRHDATTIRDGRPHGSRPPADDVARAHEQWRRVLLERGINPFLRDAAATLREAEPTGAPAHRLPGDSRTPRLRFSSPDFSSPNEGRGERTAGPRYGNPKYQSPEYKSPEYTSPNEGRGERAPGPRYGNPKYESPDFTSPDEGRERTAGPGYGNPGFSSPKFTDPADGQADRPD